MADRACDPDELAERLGHDFGRPELLIEALTHQSAADLGAGSSYERLEFLGDRVLGLVVADMLNGEFTHASVGDLARRHVDMVRAEALTKVAQEIGLRDYIRLSDGEVKAGSRDRASIQSDVMEAVLAALFLDAGLAAATRVIDRYWRPLMDSRIDAPRDPKTALQEWLQAKSIALPDYVEIGREGPAHAPLFTVEVRVPGEDPVQATGASKRAAETEAAAAMLVRLTGGS